MSQIVAATRKADVIVAGAGIAGASLAARLAGNARVLILEMETHPGYHATGRSSANYEPTYGPPVIRQLTLASGAFFRVPPDGFSEVRLLSPRGVVAVGGPDDDLRAAASIAAGYSRVDFAQAVARVPVLREGAAHYLIDDSMMDIDVDALLRGFLGQSKRGGGTLLTGARLEAGQRIGGVWRIETSQGICEAPILVDAAGAWADDLAKRCGVAPIGLIPKRRSACNVLPPAGFDIARWPQIISLNDTFYAKPNAGKMMISPADAVPSEPHDAFADDLALAEGIDAYQQAVVHEVTRIERSWGGLRTFAADGDPVVGFDPIAEGFFWCAGQGGYGIQTSPALSEVAAAMLLGSVSPYGPQLSPARLGR